MQVVHLEKRWWIVVAAPCVEVVLHEEFVFMFRVRLLNLLVSLVHNFVLGESVHFILLVSIVKHLDIILNSSFDDQFVF